VTDPLLGVWVQDNYAIGSRKAYQFNRDGSYAFTVIVGGQAVEEEEGTFAVEDDTLTLSPNTGSGRSLQWTVDKDPAVGDTRLVLGGSDIYYRP
jgi:hypothetical protein